MSECKSLILDTICQYARAYFNTREHSSNFKIEGRNASINLENNFLIFRLDNIPIDKIDIADPNFIVTNDEYIHKMLVNFHKLALKEIITRHRIRITIENNIANNIIQDLEGKIQDLK